MAEVPFYFIVKTELTRLRFRLIEVYSVFSDAFSYDEIREFKDYDVSSLGPP